MRSAGGGLSWLETGPGPATILFLHGMPGSADSWVPQLARLGSDCRAIALDLPGYGGSSLRPTIDTPRRMAAFLADVMPDALQIDGPAHVVGLSLGGMIAMELAAARPDLVASLVLLDTSPKFGLDGTSTAEGFVASVTGPLAAGLPLDEMCAAVMRDLVGPSCQPAAFDEALAAMRRATAAGLVQAARLIGNHDATATLGQIGAPTLVMTGQDDLAIPSSSGRLVATGISDAIFEEIPRAGHLSNLENPDFVNDRIFRFIHATGAGAAASTTTR